MLQVGRVPETLKVREHIDLFSSYYPAPLPIEETLAIAGLDEIKDRPYGELSGGQKQRVLFGIAICGNPDLLFLDEPTVGLDVEARRSDVVADPHAHRARQDRSAHHALPERSRRAGRSHPGAQPGLDHRGRNACRDQGTRHGQADSLHQPAERSRKCGRFPAC